MNRLYRKLPEEVLKVMIISQGWLVGGSIEALLNDKEVNDFDIIVPDGKLFQVTCKAFSGRPFKFNSFGGVKFDLGVEVDIWPEELDHFIKTANKFTYAYCVTRNILIKAE